MTRQRQHTRLQNAARQIAMGIALVSAANSYMPASAYTFAEPERLSPLAAGYLERAKLMLQDGNYAGVIDQLKHLDTRGVEMSDHDREDCTYLLALALYERGDADCVDLLREFAEAYPASPLALQARLAAADYFFSRIISTTLSPHISTSTIQG